MYRKVPLISVCSPCTGPRPYVPAYDRLSRFASPSSASTEETGTSGK